ncbi:hypothetical protein IKA92_07405 [bacterium]|nr:hypothetical protein [bacterium]MBR2387103.1 hypothetical protein [bacterium]
MSDKINGFIVVLDKEYNDISAKQTLDAIKQIKGVVKVVPNVVDARDHIAEMRIRQELTTKLFNVLTEKSDKNQ